MKGVKTYSELSVAVIKDLYKSLRKERTVLSWGEFADQIEKDRTYISRIMNGHEPLTDTVRIAIFNKFCSTTNSVAPDDKKSQPLETAGFSVNLKDYVDEIKRSREFAERMLDKTISKVGLSLEEQSQLLHAMQADLLARTQVALDSLARLENSKKPPKLNEAADRISAESQGMIERKGNGAGDIDG